uniref:Ctr_SF4_1 conopeptide n=1 Tax=Conus tribblei TaxID=101761 RepID=A0A0K8TV06_CONTD
MNCLQLLLVLLLISTTTALYPDVRKTRRRGGSIKTILRLLNSEKRDRSTGCPVKCPKHTECCSGITCTYLTPGGEYYCITSGGGGGE